MLSCEVSLTTPHTPYRHAGICSFEMFQSSFDQNTRQNLYCDDDKREVSSHNIIRAGLACGVDVNTSPSARRRDAALPVLRHVAAHNFNISANCIRELFMHSYILGPT